MQKKMENVDVKEMYVAPSCECIEVCSEGILCSSNISNTESSFDSQGDIFGGEW